MYFKCPKAENNQGFIAQLVTHWTQDGEVLGSNPIRAQFLMMCVRSSNMNTKIVKNIYASHVVINSHELIRELKLAAHCRANHAWIVVFEK